MSGNDSSMIPPFITDAVALADPGWRPILQRGLQALAASDPEYLPSLADGSFLPTQGRLFAAFAQPLESVRYVLVGEGPYPREDSATGFCFMDGAVDELWSEQGLSKRVNRATSLRNFMKMLMVAEGLLSVDATKGEMIAGVSAIARAKDSGFIQTLPDLQNNLTNEGFLLLNAALVFRSEVAPAKDAKAWRPLINVVLEALLQRSDQADQAPPTLVLWGKIAQWLEDLEPVKAFPKAVAEHPYNLSFIAHSGMQRLFEPMKLLHLR
jgi:uracil-DNA glycosylase